MDGSLPSFEERGAYIRSTPEFADRVATPENEHYFLQIVLHGTAHHVETLVRAYRRATEAESSRGSTSSRIAERWGAPSNRRPRFS